MPSQVAEDRGLGGMRDAAARRPCPGPLEAILIHCVGFTVAVHMCRSAIGHAHMCIYTRLAIGHVHTYLFPRLDDLVEAVHGVMDRLEQLSRVARELAVGARANYVHLHRQSSHCNFSPSKPFGGPE